MISSDREIETKIDSPTDIHIQKVVRRVGKIQGKKHRPTERLKDRQTGID